MNIKIKDCVEDVIEAYELLNKTDATDMEDFELIEDEDDDGGSVEGSVATTVDDPGTPQAPTGAGSNAASVPSTPETPTSATADGAPAFVDSVDDMNGAAASESVLDGDGVQIPFTEEMQTLLFAHVDAFLIDIAEYACTLMRLDASSAVLDQRHGVKLVEDVVDCFGCCGLPASYARHFQIVVLHTALDSFCLLNQAGGMLRQVRQKSKSSALYYSHPAHALTGMSIDVILAAVSTFHAPDGSVGINQPTDNSVLSPVSDDAGAQTTSPDH